MTCYNCIHKNICKPFDLAESLIKQLGRYVDGSKVLGTILQNPSMLASYCLYFQEGETDR